MKKILKNGITFSLLYGIIFYFINLILNKNNMQFMSWIYYFSYSIIILFFLIGIFQLVFKIKSKIKRNIFLIIISIFSAITISISIYVCMIAYNPEYIIIKDNKTMVATVESFHHTYINYYDYINPIMKSVNVINSEHCSSGSHNPFKTDINYIQLLK